MARSCKLHRVASKTLVETKKHVERKIKVFETNKDFLLVHWLILFCVCLQKKEKKNPKKFVQIYFLSWNARVLFIMKQFLNNLRAFDDSGRTRTASRWMLQLGGWIIERHVGSRWCQLRAATSRDVALTPHSTRTHLD